VQEMAELTMLAFDLADRYRNPAVVLADGYIGQMMEPLDLPAHVSAPPPKPWAVQGTAETRKNLVTSIHLEPDVLEAHISKLEAKYREAEQREVRFEGFMVEDAEILLVGYGIISRIQRTVVEQLRAQGVRAGLFRPITLWPFPAEALRRIAAACSSVLVTELNTGQMVEDVRLALAGRIPVEFYGRWGGNVPLAEDITRHVLQPAARRELASCSA